MEIIYFSSVYFPSSFSEAKMLLLAGTLLEKNAQLTA